MTTEVMQKASDLLRYHATSPETAAVFVVAVAAFTSISVGKEPGVQRTTEDHRQACTMAANLLSPICPHCEKWLHDSAPGEPK